jgi:uncharacterized membrane protein
MKALRQFSKFVANRLAGGFLALLPMYLTALLLLKAMKSLGKVTRPLARLLPDWLPAEAAISLLLVLILCFLVGLVIRTSMGKAAAARIEDSLVQKIPGYGMFRGMTRQLAGENQERSWKPALAEIENALVPAFIIEELDDGRFTVLVPSVPTPLAGAIYILSPERVHPLNIPFQRAVLTLTRWGTGSRDLVNAMDTTATLTR